MQQPMTDTIDGSTASSSLIGWTQVIYLLHAFSLLMGIVTAASVIGSFLTGWPSLIAVILNYVKRGEVRGTWLESHFRWQIRTFWWALLGHVIGIALIWVFIGFPILFVVGIWTLYRVIKGWLFLYESKPLEPGAWV